MSIWKPDDVECVLPVLRRYARALVKSQAAADDLVQDALVRAYERASTFQAGRSLRSWLLAILHNRFVDDERRQSLERRRDADLAQLSTGTVQTASPELTAYLYEVAARFDTLPEDQRAVLHLIAVEGLTYHEAALTLVVPVGTVMSRLARARAALRRAESAAPDRSPLRLVGGNDAQ